MPRSLLEKAMAPEVLDQSWRRLRNEHTPWSVKVNRDQLQQHLLKHVLLCREEVLINEYRPEPLRQFPMRKPDGGQRVLSAQYLRDKFVQRALLIILEPRAESLFHNDSYAYRPNRNVQLALEKVRERVKIGQYWLVDADIKKFFDSIPHKPLLSQLSGFLKDPDALRLVNKWIKLGAHQSSFLSSPRGISQGAILSPLFCNLYLNQFDQALAKANIPFVRFADDFLLFATSKDEAIKDMQFAEKKLSQLKLDLHPEKTQIIKSSPQVIFLGERLPKSPG
ncbi:MAG: Retron-type reverse transcriptase [Gammaproteobacteria bacterium]|nr:Retron-type reverse transcriptase [Gammaproteobacteria bacterium]